jgi:4-hydroxy-tetrahydrodipicolinate synthase
LPIAGFSAFWCVELDPGQKEGSECIGCKFEVTMPRHSSYLPHGVIPAVLLPFHEDLAIDEASFRKHLCDVGATPGISAITVNAHSTEVASCSFAEQRRVLEIAQDAVGLRLPLINGVWADGSLEAARIARMAADGGASALLVFPPAPFTLGQTPQMVLAHFRRIADATDLPLIVFQYPLSTGQGYPKATLLELCDKVPTICAIKDWIGQVPHHEWHVRTLQALPRRVNVLSTHSAWLFASLLLGCNGLLSGSGSVIADLQVKMFEAVQRDDLVEARRVSDLIEPLMRVFYDDPFVDMHNRMKEALVLLGRLPSAYVRPPLVKIGRPEVARIRAALVAAGLLGSAAGRNAA